MQGWGHCPGVAANSKITGWVSSVCQKMLGSTWGGQEHRWHQELSVPCGGQGQDDGKPAYVPRPNIPLSCSWPWCCGGAMSPLPMGLWGPPAPQIGGDKLLCPVGRGHTGGDMQAQRSWALGELFFLGGSAMGWGLQVRDVWAVYMGELCLGGHMGPSGQCSGAVHGGATWEQIWATSLVPQGLGATCPVPRVPVSAKVMPPWPGPAGRKRMRGQDGDERCHGPSCGHGCKSCTNTASPTRREVRECPRERGTVP